jgi:hypothetical protein
MIGTALQVTRRKLLGKQLAESNAFAADPIRHPPERHALRISHGGVRMRVSPGLVPDSLWPLPCFTHLCNICRRPTNYSCEPLGQNHPLLVAA